jgi:hypothetical protein
LSDNTGVFVRIRTANLSAARAKSLLKEEGEKELHTRTRARARRKRFSLSIGIAFRFIPARRSHNGSQSLVPQRKRFSLLTATDALKGKACAFGGHSSAAPYSRRISSTRPFRFLPRKATELLEEKCEASLSERIPEGASLPLQGKQFAELDRAEK